VNGYSFYYKFLKFYPSPADILSIKIKNPVFKGSRRNKFTIFSVDTPGWQGAKAQKYQTYSELSQRSQAGCIDV